MKTELCDFCGVNLQSCFETQSDGAKIKFIREPFIEEASTLTLCSKCHRNLIDSIIKKSKKEWKQTAKEKLRELFP